MCMQKVRSATFWPQQRTWNTSKAGRFVFESTIDRHMCPTTKPNRLFPALQFSRCSFHINKLSIQVACDNGGDPPRGGWTQCGVASRKGTTVTGTGSVCRHPAGPAPKQLFVHCSRSATVWRAFHGYCLTCSCTEQWTLFYIDFYLSKVPQRHEAEELLCRDAAFTTVTNSLYEQETVPFVGFRTRINIAT